MEIEINFRFDENGRTGNTKRTEAKDDDEDDSSVDKKNVMDYDYKVQMTNIQESINDESSPTKKSWLDDILLDCEVSDYVLMPQTYWMPADGDTKARCALEQFALDIFHHHVPEDLDFDRETSGAEWWCQLRPSPHKTGRYSAAAQECSDEDDDGSKDPFVNGISFHVDKDEELRLLTGGSTYVHPHLSTVTYLTNIGSPTLIMDCCVHPLTGEWIEPEIFVEGFVTWPAVGKHTSFDGRNLHASPPDLMCEKGAFEKQLEFTTNKDDIPKLQKRRHRRVTFLVNIWLNYHPYNVKPFPDSMIDKMSGRDIIKRKPLKFLASPNNNTSNALHVQKTTIRQREVTEIAATEKEDDNTYKAQQFTWPLGNEKSGEKLICQIPLQSISDASRKGGNVQIQWQKMKNDLNLNTSTVEGTNDDDVCFRLYDGKSTTTAAGEEHDTSGKRNPEDQSNKNKEQILASDHDNAKRHRVD